MKPQDVMLEQIGVHFVVTKQALSPKLGGGWEPFFWTGPRDDGAAVWSQDLEQATRFPDPDTAATALRSLTTPVRSPRSNTPCSERPVTDLETADEIVIRLVSHANGNPEIVEAICRDLYHTLLRRFTTSAHNRGDVQAEHLSEKIAAYCNDLANGIKANAEVLRAMPRRIQRKRTKGWRLPPGAVCVDRSTPWGNPYAIGTTVNYPSLPSIDVTIVDTEEAVIFYRQWLTGDPDAPTPRETPIPPPPTREQIRTALAGHDLACWCIPGTPCHGDILLFLANCEQP